MTDEDTFTIGQIAQKSETSASAIRFYERNGLIPKPERSSGKRQFSSETVGRLRTINVAKQAGFSLDEIRTLLDSVDQGAPAHQQLRALAIRKLPEVEELIERAQAMRDWLTTAGDCGCEGLTECNLFTPGSNKLEIVRAGGSP